MQDHFEPRMPCSICKHMNIDSANTRAASANTTRRTRSAMSKPPSASKEYRAAWREKNRARYNENARRWRAQNRAHLSEYVANRRGRSVQIELPEHAQEQARHVAEISTR